MSHGRRLIPASLIASAKAGDGKALRDLYDDVRSYVGCLLLRLAGNAAGLDELCHEICAEVLLSIGRYRGRSKFESWVYALAARQVRHWRRRQRLAQALLSARAEMYTEPPRRPDEAFLRCEALLTAAQVIIDLPQRPYLSVVLLDVVGLSPEEVSATIGGTPRSVLNAASRARDKIRARFVHLGLMDPVPKPSLRRAPAVAASELGPAGPVAGEGVRHGR